MCEVLMKACELSDQTIEKKKSVYLLTQTYTQPLN